MRTARLLAPLLLCALACPAASNPASAPEYPQMGPDIYDVRADGSAQIASALARASAEHKRVIVDFGANWCIWCRRLHATFEGDPGVAGALRRGFVVVMVDVNTRRGERRNAGVVERYGNPTAHGIPVLVVLDADGRRLATQDTGAFEEGGGHSPAKIAAFLAAWAPAGR